MSTMMIDLSRIDGGGGTSGVEEGMNGRGTVRDRRWVRRTRGCQAHVFVGLAPSTRSATPGSIRGSVRVRGEDLSLGPGAEAPDGLQAGGALEELDRAVGQRDVAPGGVAAAHRPHARVLE